MPKHIRRFVASLAAALLVGISGAAAPPQTPVANSITPAVLNPGARVRVVISGANFAPDASITVLEGTGVTASGVARVGSGRLTAEFTVAPSASRGEHRIAINTPAGPSRPIVFEVLDPPVLTGITPARGSENTQVTLTLTGTFFHPDSQPEIAGSGVTVADVQLLNDTVMNVTLIIAAGARSGPRPLVVRNRAGSSSALIFNVDGGAGKS